MKRGRRTVGFLALIGVLGLLVASCGDDDDETTPEVTTPASSEPGAGEPKRGGRLTYLYSFEGRTLDVPALSGANNIHGGDGIYGAALYDVLMSENAETGEIVMQTAESLTSTDAVTWTLKLKPNIKFTDGTAYDAAAVKFNWERIADPANRSSNMSAAQLISSMQVVDPTTLTITLKQPIGQFPRLVAKRIPFIASPTAIQAKGAAFGESPVGAGPFMLKEWQRGSQLVFERNPNYWNAPRPYLDELVVRLIPDPEQRYNSFAAGEADVANLVLAYPHVRRAERAGFSVLTTPYPIGGLHIVFNTQRAPFNDPVARRALAFAFDARKHQEVVYEGAGELATHLIREPSPFFDRNRPLPSFNAAEAQRLLDEYARAHGSPLRFTAISTEQTLQTFEFIQAELSALRNVEMQIQIVASGEFLPTVATGQFDATTFLFTGADPDPDLYEAMHSGTARNFGKYSNAEMDRALEIGQTSLDPARRKEAYATVQRIAIDEAPIMWIAGTPGYQIYHDHVRDLTTSQGFIQVDRVWVDR